MASVCMQDTIAWITKVFPRGPTTTTDCFCYFEFTPVSQYDNDEFQKNRLLVLHLLIILLNSSKQGVFDLPIKRSKLEYMFTQLQLKRQLNQTSRCLEAFSNPTEFYKEAGQQRPYIKSYDMNPKSDLMNMKYALYCDDLLYHIHSLICICVIL